jgi:hypothetical protein
VAGDRTYWKRLKTVVWSKVIIEQRNCLQGQYWRNVLRKRGLGVKKLLGM